MIIEFDDIRKVRPISENMIDEKRLKPYIEEAEKLFVIPKLSSRLYKDIDENKTNYQELLDRNVKKIGNEWVAFVRNPITNEERIVYRGFDEKEVVQKRKEIVDRK